MKKINLKLQLEVLRIHPNSVWCEVRVNTLAEEQLVNFVLPLCLCSRGQLVTPVFSELISNKWGGKFWRFGNQVPYCS